MVLLGTLVNAGTVIAGTLVGLLFKKGLPEKFTDIVMKALGLCTAYIGISGSLKGSNTLILILSMVVGTIIGQLLDLDKRINQLGKWLESKFQKKQGEGEQSIGTAFVTASLLFCVGAMAIVGSLQSGLSNDHQTLYAKAMLDGVAAVVFTSTLGWGVAFSAVLVFLYQGSIAMLAQWIAPLLTETVINEMTCVGSVIIFGLSLNMLGITKLKVMNFVPAIFLPILLCRFM